MKLVSTNKKSILFLCRGNSCRSQLAEAIVNARFGESWQAYSAGSKPTGIVHPLAIEVLSEVGIHHQGRSKSIQEFQGQKFDLVVTLCEDSEDECPVWLGKGKQVHMPFPDPSKVKGNEEKKLAAFRAVQDAIDRGVVGLLVNS